MPLRLAASRQSAVVTALGVARIDRLGGRGVLMLSNIVVATGLAGLAAAQSTAMLLAGWALIGPAQVVARLAEFGLLGRFHPLASARLAAAAHPAAALLLVTIGGPAAYGFALLHGAGNGILTIAKGTLPLALFGTAGYGRRLGWLNAPARIAQAGAPLAFGAALAAWGLHAIWLTAGIGAAALVALILIRPTEERQIRPAAPPETP